jgi:hypothetical protein
MGCVSMNACAVFNTVYYENNANKYCCNSDFCNSPSIVQKPVILPPTTTQAPITTSTTTSQGLKCKFGSSGGPVSTIACPNSSYFCGVRKTKNQ